MRYVTAIAVFALSLTAIACSLRRGIGEDCLRNTDCESANCLASVCVGEPTKNTTTPPVAPTKDAAPDAPSSPEDANADAPDGTPGDGSAVPDALLDASPDALPSDAAIDVHVG